MLLAIYNDVGILVDNFKVKINNGKDGGSEHFEILGMILCLIVIIF